MRLRERRPADAGPDPRRPQRGEAGGAGPARTASSASAPTSTRRWPTPTTRSSSTPRTTQMRAELIRTAIAAGKHVYCEKPTADNLEDALDARARWRRPRASSTAWCRTSCSCPGMPQAEDADRQRLLRPDPLGARRVRLLGLRGRPAADAAAELELQQGRGRRHHPRHALPLALRARQHSSARRSRVSCLGATHIPERYDESGKPYDADTDDAAYATFELEGGDHRADQLVLDHARAARRPRDLPRRRHARLGGGGPAPTAGRRHG